MPYISIYIHHIWLFDTKIVTTLVRGISGYRIMSLNPTLIEMGNETGLVLRMS